jgi:catechol 2,3-dioxygenase-like lactoylglutathione lyase family enzyme
MGSWTGGITAITLFVEDLAEAKRFYQAVFDLPTQYEDENSAVFGFGNTLINLLDVKAATELVDPAPVGAGDGGARAVFTLTVDDVDATYQRLSGLGVEFLNGPIDRPWGIRTASFRDPGGHIWEIAR